MAEKQGNLLKLKREFKTKNKKKQHGLFCIIHYTKQKSEKEVRLLTEVSFKKIKESAEIRQSKGNVNEKLNEICDNIPKEFQKDVHGTHRWCYKNFTNTTSILKPKNDSDEAGPINSKRRKSSEIQSPLLPKDECLFCESSRKRTHGREEQLIKCVTKNADQSIRAAAQRKQDHKLLGKILNGDLIAREAHYHTSCRKNYTRADDRDERCDKDGRVVQELNAHQNAFNYISSYIEENLIHGGTVERMTMLKERYLQFMYENSPNVYNPLYKTSKLKSKLMKKY